ncbi:MAG: homocysteine S-methyltransferase family protein [Acidobacteriia bacterium]|nr:homocysteine S-methyltransferase family protein [Terriglobia bacterium]
MAEAYLAVGTDMVNTNSFGSNSYMVTTNSFGANSFKLRAYGLADRVREFNRAAAALAREAADGKASVAGSMGPTGHILEEEGGDVSAAQLYESFAGQAAALAESGADAICIETMSSLREALEAIRAAKENGNAPVMCTFTFESGLKGFRTMMGVRPDRAAKEAAAAGADIVGANCGNGIANMIAIAGQMRAAAPSTPLLIQANAGVPVVEDGKTVFKETPEYMASRVAELVAAGANIVGGCCGTTPAHIAAIAAVVRGLRATA